MNISEFRNYIENLDFAPTQFLNISTILYEAGLLDCDGDVWNELENDPDSEIDWDAIKEEIDETLLVTWWDETTPVKNVLTTEEEFRIYANTLRVPGKHIVELASIVYTAGLTSKWVSTEGKNWETIRQQIETVLSSVF